MEKRIQKRASRIKFILSDTPENRSRKLNGLIKPDDSYAPKELFFIALSSRLTSSLENSQFFRSGCIKALATNPGVSDPIFLRECYIAICNLEQIPSQMTDLGANLYDRYQYDNRFKTAWLLEGAHRTIETSDKEKRYKILIESEDKFQKTSFLRIKCKYAEGLFSRTRTDAYLSEVLQTIEAILASREFKAIEKNFYEEKQIIYRAEQKKRGDGNTTQSSR